VADVDGWSEELPVVVGEGPVDRVPVPLLPDVLRVAVKLAERLVLPDVLELAVSLGVAVGLAVSLVLGDDDADAHAVEPISLVVPVQTHRIIDDSSCNPERNKSTGQR
jgi:hypothetical protein